MALGPPRRDVPLRQGDPVGSLVQTLISQKERRDAKARRDRLEERQGRIDAMAVEDRARAQQLEDYNVQQKMEILKVLPALMKSEAEAQSMATGAEPPPVTAKATMEEGPDGKKKTQFEGTQEEVLHQMQNKFKGEPLPLNAPADYMLGTTTGDALQIHPDVAVPGVPTTPEGTPDMIPLTPTQAPPTSIPQERATAMLDLFGIDEPVPLQTRKEFLDGMLEESLRDRRVVAAQTNQSAKGTTADQLWMFEQKEKIKSRYKADPKTGAKPQGSISTGIWRYNPETDEIEVLSQPRPKASSGDDELARPPAKVIEEMRDIEFLSKKTLNLAELESDYKYEVAEWTPNIIRNAMSGNLKDKDDKFFKKYQKYDPAYFLFAAEMLKATQGGRPSDKDLEFYLKKMPRISDLPDVKAEKVHWLLNQLKDKADATIDVYGPWYEMERFDRIDVPSKAEILKMSTGASSAKAIGTGNIKSIERVN